MRRDPKGRALSGLSMGGRHTMFVGFKSLDLFASFGVLSAGDVDSEKSIADFLNDPDVNRKVDYLFVGQGTEEAKGRMGERCVALHEALLNHDIKHEYYVGGYAGHDWATWRHLVYYRFLPGLWRTQAPAAPGKKETTAESRPARTNVLGAEYPRVTGDLRGVFQFKAPGAQRVQVDIIGVKYDMVKDDGGVWSVTTPPLVPGFHYYAIVVDGAGVNDPGSHTFFGVGKDMSGIEIPEKDVDYYLPRDVPHGQVRTVWYRSTVTGDWRRCLVYTPPDYDASPAKRYPVLYLQHGSGEDETGWIEQGYANFVLDNLIAEKKAVPMIVVMDKGYAARAGQPAPSVQPPTMVSGTVRAARTQGRERVWRRAGEGRHPAYRRHLPHARRSRPSRHGRPVDGRQPDVPHHPVEPRQVLVDRDVQRNGSRPEHRAVRPRRPPSAAHSPMPRRSTGRCIWSGSAWVRQSRIHSRQHPGLPRVAGQGRHQVRLFRVAGHRSRVADLAALPERLRTAPVPELAGWGPCQLESTVVDGWGSSSAGSHHVPSSPGGSFSSRSHLSSCRAGRRTRSCRWRASACRKRVERHVGVARRYFM